MGVEIVENDVDLAIPVLGDDLVHEVEEWPVSTAPVATASWCHGNVIVAAAGERAAVRPLEIALRPLKRLDMRLLVNPQHEGAVGRIEIEADEFGAFGHEVGIAADASGLAGHRGRSSAPAGSAEVPDVLVGDVTQHLRDKATGPARRAVRRRLLELGQDAPVGRRIILMRRGAAAQPWPVGNPVVGKPVAPQATS